MSILVSHTVGRKLCQSGPNHCGPILKKVARLYRRDTKAYLQA